MQQGVCYRCGGAVPVAGNLREGQTAACGLGHFNEIADLAPLRLREPRLPPTAGNGEGALPPTSGDGEGALPPTAGK